MKKRSLLISSILLSTVVLGSVVSCDIGEFEDNKEEKITQEANVKLENEGVYEGGKVTLTAKGYIPVGTIVYVNVEVNDGYKLNSLTVNNAEIKDYQFVAKDGENLVKASFAKDSSPVNPDDPVDPVTGNDGSLEHPFTTTEAIAKCEEVGEVASTEYYYVAGTITEIAEASEKFSNFTFTISDGTNPFLIYRAKVNDGDTFTTDYIAVGDDVIVYGQLINYKGDTPEITTGGKIVSRN